MWHLHKWGKWETTEEGNLELVSKWDPSKPAIKYGSYLKQQRTCLVCNKTQLHTERTT